jgi:heptosyltransferase-2
LYLTKNLSNNVLSDFVLTKVSNLIVKIIRAFIKKNSTGNIVIISLHRLGDSVFTIPTIEQLFRNIKNQKVFLLTFQENKEIYKLKFNEEAIITLEKRDFFFEHRIASYKARKILRDLNPQVIIDITGNIVSASLIITAKANKIVGMNTKYFQNLYNPYVSIRNKPHLIDLYLEAANSYEYFDETKILKVFPINFNSKATILIHPFAGWKEKEWNLKKYIQLAIQLNEFYKIELISSPGLISKDVISEIEEQRLTLTLTLTINELIDRIKCSSVFISNDSGPLYVANLLGKPTFTIYGPTNPEYSVPFGEIHGHIRKELSCSPTSKQYCLHHAGLFCPSNECMQQLDIDIVKNSIIKFLNQLGIEKKIV